MFIIGNDSTVPLTCCFLFAFACGVNVTECDSLNAVSCCWCVRSFCDSALGSGLINVILEPDASLYIFYVYGVVFVLILVQYFCFVGAIDIGIYLSRVCKSASTDRLRACRKSHSNEKAASPGVTRSGSC